MGGFYLSFWLRNYLHATGTKTAPERNRGIKLWNVTFRGEGLNPEFAGKGWPVIHDPVYGDRGS